MIEYENQCCDCAHEIGCLGAGCPNRRVPVLYCDKCGDEVSSLRLYGDDQLCDECFQLELLNEYPVIDEENCEQYADE